jgi:hypothetical protein
MTFFFRRFAKRKAELDQEIQAYLEMDIHARMKRGESAERARAAAMRELGNVALIDFDRGDSGLSTSTICTGNSATKDSRQLAPQATPI